MTMQSPACSTPFPTHASTAAAPASQPWSRRILVVDDEADARYLECRLLARAGYVVDAAADGEEAWQVLRSVSYDLVLCDQHMPRLCGLDLVARMRGAGMAVPVIIHSG